MKILLLCVALLLTWDNGMVLGEQEFSDNELQGPLTWLSYSSLKAVSGPFESLSVSPLCDNQSSYQCVSKLISPWKPCSTSFLLWKRAAQFNMK
ncbi:clusterin, isoform CRA_b [Rattus norvegicus]|uniref:Clusterin, isoform CRA_b n=1 Tax=Rattus norvegicus TaxID=10116 RepID=A6K6L3_RAT|nr:clusterin, isoform CRA_b [Rattus norvegicus]